MSPLFQRQYKPDSAASQNRQTYVPQGISDALSQHAQQTLPTHLRKYADGSGGYVPRHAQDAISKHMQKNTPAHLRQYTDAYVQQNMVDAGTIRPMVQRNSNPGIGRAPTPNVLRQDHSGAVGGEQHTAQMMNLFTPDSGANPTGTQALGYAPQQPQNQAYPAQTQTVPVQGQPATPDGGAYDFIMDSSHQPTKRSPLPGGNSLLGRVLLIGGGAIVLLIAFIFIKNLIFPGPDFSGYLVIAQDQQALAHTIEGDDSSTTKASLPEATQNFLATAQLTLPSAQASVMGYLTDNKQKVSPAQLNLKISSQTDEQLKAAIGAGSYDTTLREVVERQLTTYMSDLQQAYKQAEGHKRGQEILSKNYDQAELLLNQLKAASDS